MISLNFINSLEHNKSKTKYQAYNIDMGLEQIDIIIPFNNVYAFEEKINEIKPTTKRKLNSLLEEFNGQIEHIGPTDKREK